MNFKKSQSGRSMVEMLGVLAIIGVLSVGGIAGYSLSMRRHRANQIVDLISKYALVAYNKYQQELTNPTSTGTSSFDFPFESTGIGPLPSGVDHFSDVVIINTNTDTGIDTVEMSVSFDDDKICKAVASTIGKVLSNECDYLSHFLNFEIPQN